MNVCQWILCLVVIVSGCQLSGCAADGSSCTSGFISLDRLLGLGLFPTVITHGQSLYPSTGFTCRGNITEWIVMGRHVGSIFNENVPYLQTWRQTEEEGMYVRVSSTPLEFGELGTDTDELGVYHYPVNPPVEFQAGDIIGMFQAESGFQFRVFTQYDSASEFFYIPAAPAVEPTMNVFNTSDKAVLTSDDVPLVTVSTADPGCTVGFTSLERLQAEEDALSNGALMGGRVSGVQVVLPRLNFTCNGYITKWIVAGAWRGQNTVPPELQVWRSSNNGSNSGYHKVGSTSISAAVENTLGLVFEQPVEPPLPFMAGDVLGFFQPEELGDSRLTLFLDLLNSAGTVFYHNASSPASVVNTTGGQSQQLNLPVVTVEISTSTPSPTLSPSHTPTLSPSHTPTPDDSLSLAALIAIITGVVGGLLVLLTIITALVLCKCHKRRKAARHRKAADEIQAKDNQAYGSAGDVIDLVQSDAYGVTSLRAGGDVETQENLAYSSVASVDIVTVQNDAYDIIVSGSGDDDIPTGENVCYDCGCAEEGVPQAEPDEECHEYEYEEAAVPTEQSESYDDVHEYELLELT